MSHSKFFSILRRACLTSSFSISQLFYIRIIIVFVETHALMFNAMMRFSSSTDDVKIGFSAVKVRSLSAT